jgi:hypothetical protein
MPCRRFLWRGEDAGDGFQAIVIANTSVFECNTGFSIILVRHARAKVMDLFCSPSLNTNIIVRVLAVFALPLGWRHVWKARALELSAWWGCTNASVVLLWGREGVVTVCLDAPGCCLGIATNWTNHAEHNTSLKSPSYVNELSCLIVDDMCLVNNVCRALLAPYTLPYTPRHQSHSSHE